MKISKLQREGNANEWYHEWKKVENLKTAVLEWWGGGI
jgi:hypothetical protein